MKTLAILGDSYSTYKGYIDKDYDCWYPNKPQNVTGVEQTWWRLLCNECDLKIINNSSYSGSTVCNTGYDKEDSSYSSFVTRIEKDFKGKPNADIMLIFGCTNDFWAGSPIGKIKYENINQEDLKSFAPAFCYMIKKALEYNKGSKIYNIVNDELPSYITDIIKEVTKKYEIENIFLKKIDKIDGHPTDLGMQQIKDQVRAYIEE